MTLSKLLLTPFTADDVRLFLIIAESNVSHCLWEQVMNLSKLLITPSIADDERLSFDYFGVEGEFETCLTWVKDHQQATILRGHSHGYIQECQLSNNSSNVSFRG
jgi:hypothetical protein